jgi:hypothetical protein
VNGVAVDSVEPTVDYRYLLYRAEKWKSVASVEGIPGKISGVLEDISRISAKTEYVIVAPEAFQTPAVALAEFRSEEKRSQHITLPSFYQRIFIGL